MNRSLPPCLSCLRAQLPRQTWARRYKSGIVEHRERLDPSMAPLMGDLHMGTRTRRKARREAMRGEGLLGTKEDRLENLAAAPPQAVVKETVVEEEEVDEEEVRWEDRERREERSSPAAVFGSKRIGAIELPNALINAIQSQIDESNPHDLRQSYLSLLPTLLPPSLRASPLPTAHLPAPSPSEKPTRPSRQTAVTPLSALAQAAAVLPGEYGVLEGVLRELKGRVGEGEWQRWGQAGWVVWDGGLGSGAWALLEINNLLPSSTILHDPPTPPLPTSNNPLTLLQSSLHLQTLSTCLLPALPSLSHSRSLPALPTPPAVVMSTFYLSKLPTRSARLNRLREMWDTGAEVIVIVDRGDDKGFSVVSEARAFLLGLGRTTEVGEDGGVVNPEKGMNHKERKAFRKEERRKRREERMREGVDFGDEDAVEVVAEVVEGGLKIGGEVYYEDVEGAEVGKEKREKKETVGSYVIAPCPHDGTCPLLSTRDICHFSQRLQSPPFLRKTKHSSRGDEDSKYTYVIIRRGSRPASPSALNGLVGRLGAVGKEEIQALKDRISGKRGVLVPVEGAAGYETLETFQLQETGVEEGQEGEVQGEMRGQEMEGRLREEAYSWPRLIYPPMKRKGHVTMDTCHPSGDIVRMTLSKSQSKQIYHDARKVSWGDLFPHEPAATPIVRTRGVRKLSKFEAAQEMDEDVEAEDGKEAAALEETTEVEVIEFEEDVDEDALAEEFEGDVDGEMTTGEVDELLGGVDGWPVAALEDIETELGLPAEPKVNKGGKNKVKPDWKTDRKDRKKGKRGGKGSDEEEEVIVRTFEFRE